ncbi:hypothetical protein FQA47_015280 [Oryzias melastigma]|uniref:Uncharacterized protein n=1 Tax=Oryzias melastigma TaxID=30732 RepID=A0A834FFT1_ORYME|nr:hypothetical protein FQA47_015280 [Oryzias melastigma]
MVFMEQRARDQNFLSWTLQHARDVRNAFRKYVAEHFGGVLNVFPTPKDTQTFILKSKNLNESLNFGGNLLLDLLKEVLELSHVIMWRFYDLSGSVWTTGP